MEPKSKPSPLTSAEWKLVLLLAAINFTHILDFVIVMPLGDQLRHELSITPRQFGYIVSAYGICATITGIIASTVIDRFDRRKTMLWSFVGFLAATWYCGLAPSYTHLLIARGLSGLCGGIVASTVMAFIVELIPEQRRGRAIGAVTSSFAFASTIGLPIGLALANASHHFGTPFIAIAIFGTLVLAATMLLLPSLPGTHRDLHVHPMKTLVHVARQANHLWSFAFMITMIFGTFMIVPYIAPYLQANCGLSRGNLPLVYAVAGIFSLFVMNFSGWLTDHFGPRRVFAGAAGAAIVMTLVITNLPPVSLVIAVLVTTLFMCVASSRMVPAQAMMLRSADPKSRGAFTSLNTAMSHFATGIGPLISGSIIGEVYPGGPLTQYWLVGVVAVCFGLLAIGLSFMLRPPSEAAALTA
ncbi:Purine efflux pump PbuE [Allorhodopirellula heiligendammensis]|uniref:Purine efflux pump PbuE n=1 Tax=Allorhodopirellula heiligendammensis TaxID=2714739 RepID=A0A5C6C3K9_9BACT|nr:Purine efflux pump PbuE [Allorhodopirellula heiligendammensis]